MPAPFEPLPSSASLSCFSCAANEEVKQSTPQPTRKATTFSECQLLLELRPRSEHRDTGFMAFLPVYGTRPLLRKFPQRLIGIGGVVTHPPLPHDRTCGSASGGSAG